MPKAARITDMHTCPAVNPGPVPHVGGPISSGSPDVNVGYLRAARVDDTAICVPATDAISSGSSNVFINHKKAARIGDPTRHGGVIVMGCATVNIGETAQSFALKTASLSGAPFCEECEKAKRQMEELRAPPPPNEPPVDSLGVEKGPPKPKASPSELAKQPNKAPDDGHNQTRRGAREKVAGDFLAAQSQPPSAAEVESQLRNIDMDRPVEVVVAKDNPNTPALRSRAPGSGDLQFLVL